MKIWLSFTPPDAVGALRQIARRTKHRMKSSNLKSKTTAEKLFDVKITVVWLRETVPVITTPADAANVRTQNGRKTRTARLRKISSWNTSCRVGATDFWKMSIVEHFMKVGRNSGTSKHDFFGWQGRVGAM